MLIQGKDQIHFVVRNTRMLYFFIIFLNLNGKHKLLKEVRVSQWVKSTILCIEIDRNLKKTEVKIGSLFSSHWYLTEKTP